MQSYWNLYHLSFDIKDSRSSLVSNSALISSSDFPFVSGTRKMTKKAPSMATYHHHHHHHHYHYHETYSGEDEVAGAPPDGVTDAGDELRHQEGDHPVEGDRERGGQSLKLSKWTWSSYSDSHLPSPLEE